MKKLLVCLLAVAVLGMASIHANPAHIAGYEIPEPATIIALGKNA